MKRKSCHHTTSSGMYRRFASVATALAANVFKALGTNIGDKAYELISKNRLSELITLSVNPMDYQSSSKFRDDYLVCEMMSKFDSFDLGIDRTKVAINKFLETEKQCEQTNKRLSSLYVNGVYSPYTPESFIWTARVKIEQLLGPLSWDECFTHFNFGPGASTSVKRKFGDAYFKYGVAKPHTTKANSLLALCAVKCIPRWFEHLLAGRDPITFLNLPIEQQIEELFEIVPGNKVTTVPKNAKTDRVIAIEPDLNMFIQKGIGGVIRSRLKRVGVNLNDQTKNQTMAHLASITNKFATIDLSSASDTISWQLVELLLPSDWVEAIKQSRSPSGVLPDGSVIHYQKVSSMGNGFTFELESLIFWAICSSVISLLRPDERQLAVYGDDIIISSQVCQTTLWLLKYLGFTPNTKKTFTDGPFRESCGKHYFLGTDVTPFYIRKDIKSSDRLIHFANSLRSWAKLSYGLDSRFESSYRAAVDLLPKYLQKPSIPEFLGHIALWGDFDEVRPHRARKQVCGWVALGFQEVRKPIQPDDLPLLVRNLKIISNRRGDDDFLIQREADLDLSEVLPRTQNIKWRVVKPVVAQWESHGPWL